MGPGASQLTTITCICTVRIKSTYSLHMTYIVNVPIFHGLKEFIRMCLLKSVLAIVEKFIFVSINIS